MSLNHIEGEEHVRILIPVYTKSELLTVANVYELAI